MFNKNYRNKYTKTFILFSLLLFFIMIIIFTYCDTYYCYAIDETKNNITNNLPSIDAESAILIDNRTNKILYNKNKDKKMYPASTTKIVTAILALENSDINTQIKASSEAVMSIPDGYSTANIKIGEILSVEQLIEMLLVHSANDAANILAEQIGGSIESFVSMMNTKVTELGLTNTHFTNTYGKHDNNHYTTSHDLAKIMQYCLKNESFRKIAGKASCAIPQTNLSPSRIYTSTNELILPNGSLYYSYITAGKTGYTSQAGNCLVSSSYKDNLELICVVLGCPSTSSTSRFVSTKKLYDYGYYNYHIENIVKEQDIVTQIEIKGATSDTKNLNLIAKEDISILLDNSINKDEITPEIKLNDNIVAPIEEGSILRKNNL